MKLYDIRDSYNLSKLTKEDVDPNPFVQFDLWMKDAIKNKVLEPTAMSVSTINSDGFPENRVVLLKFYDDEKFTFFTNYNSKKGESIQINNKVSLHFFWPTLQRQIRILGTASKENHAANENYFNSRPIDSQIGAWASKQSHEIPSRDYLEEQFKEFKEKFQKNPPLPDFWGGYVVKPIHFEFWQGRENRLHDRIVYDKENSNNWLIKRLAP